MSVTQTGVRRQPRSGRTHACADAQPRPEPSPQRYTDAVVRTYPFLDLGVAASASLLITVLIVAFPEWYSPVRIVLGLLQVLVLPGYALTSALFPRISDIDGVERLALTLGLSIAVVPLIGLILNYTPWGIRLTPIALSLSAFILAMSLIAWLRRRAVPEQQRYRLPVETPSFRNNLLVIGFTVIAIGGVIALANTLRPTETFTEFYILGPEGKLENYPTLLTAGEPYELTFGIGNHEGRDMTYSIMSPAGSTPFVHTVKVPAGETWEETLTLTAPQSLGVGEVQIPYYLYTSQHTGAYRSLHLNLTLIPPLD